ncbi:hypothetical protein MMC28_001690 [Mycoblastus sanguinarius]|nr:hypothetical protein [Mycoblastus sanguinarius]
MTSPTSLLQLLQSRTAVDCDTLDADVAENLGPFQDCTLNQAIAFNEIQGDQHKSLLHSSVALAKLVLGHFQNVTFADLAVEIAMIKLSHRMIPHVRGFIHVQTNPLHSYCTSKTADDARRMINLSKHIDPDFDISRICIKIPSTWEGLQACRVLQNEGIITLATTLFTLAQAALAAETEKGYKNSVSSASRKLLIEFNRYKGDDPIFELCVSAQRYYKQHDFSTKVLPASLTSINEIMLLAGVDHITIAPALLRELASTEVNGSTVGLPSLIDKVETSADLFPPRLSYVDDEPAFRMAMTRDKNGTNEAKLVQAINIFCDLQLKFEALMEQYGAK